MVSWSCHRAVWDASPPSFGPCGGLWYPLGSLRGSSRSHLDLRGGEFQKCIGTARVTVIFASRKPFVDHLAEPRSHLWIIVGPRSPLRGVWGLSVGFFSPSWAALERSWAALPFLGSSPRRPGAAGRHPEPASPHGHSVVYAPELPGAAPWNVYTHTRVNMYLRTHTHMQTGTHTYIHGRPSNIEAG